MSGVKRRTAYRKNVEREVLDDLPEMEEGHCIVQVVQSHGGNIFETKAPDGSTTLARLPTRFRNLIWVKRGAFLLCSSADGTFETASGSAGRVTLNVERVLYKDQIRHLQSMGKWPEPFHAAVGEDKEVEAASGNYAQNGTGDEDDDGLFVNRNRMHQFDSSASELSSEDEED
eukprot:g914.t1